MDANLIAKLRAMTDANSRDWDPYLLAGKVDDLLDEIDRLQLAYDQACVLYVTDSDNWLSLMRHLFGLDADSTRRVDAAVYRHGYALIKQARKEQQT